MRLSGGSLGTRLSGGSLGTRLSGGKFHHLHTRIHLDIIMCIVAVGILLFGVSLVQAQESKSLCWNISCKYVHIVHCTHTMITHNPHLYIHVHTSGLNWLICAVLKFVFLSVCVYLNTQTDIHTHTHIHTHAHTHTYTHTCTHIHSHTLTHTHTHAQSHILTHSAMAVITLSSCNIHSHPLHQHLLQ